MLAPFRRAKWYKFYLELHFKKVISEHNLIPLVLRLTFVQWSYGTVSPSYISGYNYAIKHRNYCLKNVWDALIICLVVFRKCCSISIFEIFGCLMEFGIGRTPILKPDINRARENTWGNPCLLIANLSNRMYTVCCLSNICMLNQYLFVFIQIYFWRLH